MTPERLQQIKERYADEMIRRDHVAELIDAVDHLTAEVARLRAGIEALLIYLVEEARRAGVDDPLRLSQHPMDRLRFQWRDLKDAFAPLLHALGGDLDALGQKVERQTDYALAADGENS